MERGKQKILIKDACILFDLVDLDLLTEFFQLDLIILTTIQVIGEVTDESQMLKVTEVINNGKLQIDEEGELQSISGINEKYPGLSFADSSVLELAKRKDAIVLSSDGSLRKISIKENLTVRGFLWIIEELCNTRIINVEIALEKLEQYKGVNQRAPRKEIEDLKNKIQS